MKAAPLPASYVCLSLICQLQFNCLFFPSRFGSVLYRMQDAGNRIQDAGYRMQDAGYSIRYYLILEKFKRGVYIQR